MVLLKWRERLNPRNTGSILLPSTTRLCRFITTNRDYTVCDRFPSPVDLKLSLKKEFSVRPAKSPNEMKRVLKVDCTEPEIDLRLGLFDSRTQCIAFRKESGDSRQWNFQRDF
jgi:hypothetical protein